MAVRLFAAAAIKKLHAQEVFRFCAFNFSLGGSTGTPMLFRPGPQCRKFPFVFSIRLAGGAAPSAGAAIVMAAVADGAPDPFEIARKALPARHAEAIKLTCISQNFNDRRARAAHSDWRSLTR